MSLIFLMYCFKNYHSFIHIELPDCRYTARQDVAVISMDELQFAASREDCQSLCDHVCWQFIF
jgi:hypothetical protein